MSEPTIQVTQQQMNELLEGRGCLRGMVEITRAATGKVENYEIELRPMPQEQPENSHG